MILPISLAALEVIISISMMWTFVSRLYSLILMESVHYYDESMKAMAGASDAAVIHSQHSLRRRTYKMSFTDDSQMMHISVKIAILITVSLTSSNVLMGLRAADCFVSSETLIGKAMAMYIQLDTMISCICLVLFLPRTQRGFEVLCCCCNNLASRLMIRLLHRSTVGSLHRIQSARITEIAPTVQSGAENTTTDFEKVDSNELSVSAH